eukprot:scaffold213100_cov30-Tisochrysis_lutea.AAC.2
MPCGTDARSTGPTRAPLVAPARADWETCSMTRRPRGVGIARGVAAGRALLSLSVCCLFTSPLPPRRLLGAALPPLPPVDRTVPRPDSAMIPESACPPPFTNCAASRAFVPSIDIGCIFSSRSSRPRAARNTCLMMLADLACRDVVSTRVSRVANVVLYLSRGQTRL